MRLKKIPALLCSLALAVAACRPINKPAIQATNPGIVQVTSTKIPVLSTPSPIPPRIN